jgi:hypothetical protein
MCIDTDSPETLSFFMPKSVSLYPFYTHHLWVLTIRRLQFLNEAEEICAQTDFFNDPST